MKNNNENEKNVALFENNIFHNLIFNIGNNVHWPK